MLDKLKDIREDNDLTQKQMAEILNVKRSTYSLWELGKNIIPLPKLLELSNMFKISMDYLCGLSQSLLQDAVKKSLMQPLMKQQHF